MKKAVGFYWTLPVPWISEPFTQLSSDVEQAAKESRTIRYQREVVRRWARQSNIEISKEGVYLELEPDRAGSSWHDFNNGMPSELYEIVDYCRKENAEILYVDFGAFIHQRSHLVMNEKLRESGISHVGIWPDENSIEIDGELFNPEDHFRNWRDRHHEWKKMRHERQEEVAQVALSLRRKAHKLSDIANTLNRYGLPTPHNKKWTTDNLRKFLKKYGADESQSSDQVDGGT